MSLGNNCSAQYCLVSPGVKLHIRPLSLKGYAVSRRLLPKVFSRFWVLWGLWALWGAAIVGAAAYDSALVLHGPHGRGLLQHFGFQAIFLSGPILLVGTYTFQMGFIDSLQRLLRRQPTYHESSTIQSEIQSLVGPISIHSIWGQCFLLFSTIGIIFTFIRLRWLEDPFAFWGNDVFNAQHFLASYLVSGSFLLVLWGGVYPFVVVRVLHTTILALFIVPHAIDKGVLRLDLLHPDGHGGMTRLAGINAYITTIYAVPAMVLVLLYITHDRVYFSPRVAALMLLVIFLTHTIAGLASIAYSISSERDRAVALWNDKISRLMTRRRLGSTETLIAFKYRDCLLSVSLFPFRKTGVFVATLLALVFSAAVAYFEWVAK
jgi:hypothetical protein